MPIKHRKVSPKADGPDPGIVHASDWNDTHDLSGLVVADLSDSGAQGRELVRTESNDEALFALDLANHSLITVDSTGRATVGAGPTQALDVATKAYVDAQQNTGPQGPVGPPGADGAQGPKGDPGVRGPQGDPGATGPQGNDGATGATGAQGPQGDPGKDGPQGNTGAQGVQGVPGATGATGADGAQGPKGDTGATGAQGPQGDVGPQGIQGTTGTTGAVGAQGPKGDQGVPGVAGTDGAQGVKGDPGTPGATGSQGAKGDPGVQGPQGDIGPKGDKGDTGAQGPQGDTGAEGTPGTGIQIIGSVPDVGALPPTGNSPGDAYIVESDGHIWIWNGSAWTDGGQIQGPVGPQGAQGVQGPQGTKGDPGAQGPQGVAGATGSQGPKGDTGATGTTGAQGSKGDTGVQGPAGADSVVPGPQGPQGVAGATGGQGPKGDPGAQGTTGATGAPGTAGATGPAGADSTVPGPQGPKGDPGATGAQGIPGTTGAQGVQGDPGTPGATGGTGAQGAKGDPGIQGIQGVQGDPGPQGPKGDKGDTGATGTPGTGFPDSPSDGSGYGRLNAAWAKVVKLTGDTMTGPLILPNGTAAAPGFGFTGGANYGVFYSASLGLAFTAGGSNRLNIGTDITATVVHKAVNGTAAAPAYSFTNSTNMGLLRVSNTVMGIAVGGSTALMIAKDGLTIQPSNGSTPRFYMENDNAPTGKRVMQLLADDNGDFYVGGLNDGYSVWVRGLQWKNADNKPYDIGSGLAFVLEAANDTNTYGRKGLAWTAITAASVGLGNVTNVAQVAKAGDTMTGPLILNADPTNVLGAVTKQYVDAKPSGIADAPTTGEMFTRKVGTWTPITDTTGTLIAPNGTVAAAAALVSAAPTVVQFVQSAIGGPSSATTTALATTAGNTFVAVLTGGTNPSFSDSKTNAWPAPTLVASFDPGTGPLDIFMSVLSGATLGGSGHTFTVNDTTGMYSTFQVIELTPSTMDAGSRNGVGDAVTPFTISTHGQVQPNNLVLLFGSSYGGTTSVFAESTGFTKIAENTDNADYCSGVAYQKTVSTTAAVASSQTDAGTPTTNGMALAIAAFTHTSTTPGPLTLSGTSVIATSPVVLPADPTLALQAATKQYVDAKAGGSGVWIGDTAPVDMVKYPLWWSSTSLQLSIWYNDGSSSQWVDTNAEPSTAVGASPITLVDGTVTTPGLAWASEPGMGLFRSSASQISMVAQGNHVAVISANVATNSYLALYPHAAGGSSLYLEDGPVGAANVHNFALTNDATGYHIFESLAGTATAKPLNLAFPAGIINNVPVIQQNSIAGADCNYILNKQPGATQSVLWGRMNNLNRWAILLGGNGAESSGNVGSDFNVLAYDDSGAFKFNCIGIYRSNGIATLPNNPAFRVRTSVAPNVGNVGFNIVDYNRGGCYTAGNGRFTAPVPGAYRFSWQHLLINGTAGEYRIALLKNGGMVTTTIKNVTATTGYETISISAVIDLAVGDYVNCYFSSGPTTLYLDQNYNCFCGEFVG